VAGTAGTESPGDSLSVGASAHGPDAPKFSTRAFRQVPFTLVSAGISVRPITAERYDDLLRLYILAT
jgi:hypothetical protein